MVELDSELQKEKSKIESSVGRFICLLEYESSRTIGYGLCCCSVLPMIIGFVYLLLMSVWFFLAGMFIAGLFDFVALIAIIFPTYEGNVLQIFNLDNDGIVILCEKGLYFPKKFKGILKGPLLWEDIVSITLKDLTRVKRDKLGQIKKTKERYELRIQPLKFFETIILDSKYYSVYALQSFYEYLEKHSTVITKSKPLKALIEHERATIKEEQIQTAVEHDQATIEKEQFQMGENGVDGCPICGTKMDMETETAGYCPNCKKYKIISESEL